MNNVEDLIIYKQYVELIYYTEQITKKYPKSERFCLCTQIKNCTYDGIKNILTAYKKYDKSEKLAALNNLDIDLKMLKILVRISKKNKYINNNNYCAWVKKLTNINNLMLGWFSKCAKV